MLLRLNQQEMRFDRKKEKKEEQQKRIAEGTDGLFGEGKGDLIMKKSKPKVAKKQSLKKKKSGLLAISGEEWLGQTVDIWAPR